MSIEHLACAEAEALRRRLLASYTAAQENSTAPATTFSEWLRVHAAARIGASHAPLIVTFCQLVRWYHRCLCALAARRDCQPVATCLGIVKCQHTGELLHLAAVARGAGADGSLVFASLGHAGGSSGLAVKVSERFGRYVQLARELSAVCLRQVRAAGC
jgi:hypothetical protein